MIGEKLIAEKLTGRILVLGYGNPGRQDDGLGPAAAEALERLRPPGVRVEISYQLNIEDAADAAEQDFALFIDAAEQGPEPFGVREVHPARDMSFTSHLVKPEVLLAICRSCYCRSPRAYLIGIRGYEFELQEGLTERAQANLDQAIVYLRSLLCG